MKIISNNEYELQKLRSTPAVSWKENFVSLHKAFLRTKADYFLPLYHLFKIIKLSTILQDVYWQCPVLRDLLSSIENLRYAQNLCLDHSDIEERDEVLLYSGLQLGKVLCSPIKISGDFVLCLVIKSHCVRRMIIRLKHQRNLLRELASYIIRKVRVTMCR